MTPALLAALLAPLLAAPAYELDLTERSEFRVRSPGDGLDFAQEGTALLVMSLPRLRLSVEYTPSLTFTDFVNDLSVDLLHSGDVLAQFDFHRARLRLEERAAYGTRSFTSLKPNTYDLVLDQAGMHIIPISTSVDYGLSDTTLALGFVLSRRTNFGVSVGYMVEGGLNDRSRRVIPFIYGPRASLDFGYRVSPRDELTTTVNAETMHTDTGSFGPKRRSDVVRGMETWSRQLARRTSGELAGGVAWDQRDPSPDDPEAFPIGFLVLRHDFPNSGGVRSDVLGRAQVDVQLDRLTGLPDYRYLFGLESTWAKDPYEVYGQVGRTASLRESQLNSLAQYAGEVGLRYQWLEPLLVEVGVRGAYQDVDRPTTAATFLALDGFNWMTFVALRASAEPIRF